MKKGSSDLPLHLKNILPSNYTYKLKEYKDKEREYFIGASKEAFKALFTISNITSAEQVKTWVLELASTANIKYNTQGGYQRKGLRVQLSFEVVHLLMPKEETREKATRSKKRSK